MPDFFSQKPEDFSSTFIGPTVGNNDDNFNKVKELANKNDPTAITLLNFYEQSFKELDNIHKELKFEGDLFRKELERYEKNLKKSDNLIIGVLIFVGITFVSTISLVFFDLIKEKELYLRYNDVYKNYSDKTSVLEEKMNNQIIQINNLGNDLEMLKAKNLFLK